MKVGLFHLIVLDDDTSFKRTFIAIRQASNKNYDMLAKRNHKGLIVESFHRILRKRVTIAAEERGIIDMFVPTGIATGYTWNSMLIVGTYIPRRILAMNRKLHFSLKINLNIFPTITQNNSQATINYLNLTDSSRYFSFSILKISLKNTVQLIPNLYITTEILLFCSLTIVSWLEQPLKVISKKR